MPKSSTYVLSSPLFRTATHCFSLSVNLKFRLESRRHPSMQLFVIILLISSHDPCSKRPILSSPPPADGKDALVVFLSSLALLTFLCYSDAIDRSPKKKQRKNASITTPSTSPVKRAVLISPTLVFLSKGRFVADYKLVPVNLVNLMLHCLTTLIPRQLRPKGCKYFSTFLYAYDNSLNIRQQEAY